ncbi:MaoC family dehydratase [Amycolatopsis alkalitolerans]|uniref:MaoC family dehydratase n=1 Tax=Amycolatopsis alkalitolerans TaxID=2547244 RepID=A0A5C4M4X0_9PSEU|nr:MaoC family dehydratase [Amycolatopsis alkalitolerans]
MTVTRYWEDFREGQVFDLGSATVSKDDIVDFGRRWIPQPFHVDEASARDSPFGGLIASGWHTACLFMRLYYEHLLAGSASLGSPGVRDMRWLEPVRPGQVLCASATVLRTSVSSTTRGRGTVEMRWECARPDGVVVLRMIGTAFFARRPCPVS